jgi:hypothetical protein
MPRGGKRPNAGRRRNKPEAEDGKLTKGFASRVLARIRELDLKDDNGHVIKNAEDYALQILRAGDAEARAFFRNLLDRQYGKPAQAVVSEGKLTIEVVELADRSPA